MAVRRQLAVERFAVLSPQLRDRWLTLRVCTSSQVPSEVALATAVLASTLIAELVYSKQGTYAFCFTLSKEWVQVKVDAPTHIRPAAVDIVGSQQHHEQNRKQPFLSQNGYTKEGRPKRTVKK